MESSRYWQNYKEREKRSPNSWTAGRGIFSSEADERTERDIFVHGGRCMSLEVYLAVPTFIRRGLSIAA